MSVFILLFVRPSDTYVTIVTTTIIIIFNIIIYNSCIIIIIAYFHFSSTTITTSITSLPITTKTITLATTTTNITITTTNITIVATSITIATATTTIITIATSLPGMLLDHVIIITTIFLLPVALELLKQPDECSFYTNSNNCQHHMEDLMREKLYQAFLHHPSLPSLTSLCNVYNTWQHCNHTLVHKCGVKEWDRLGKEQSTIMKSCLHHKHKLKHSLSCLEGQSLNNPLFASCSFLASLKHHNCITETGSLRCEDRLVRTACGSTVANFRLSVAIETTLNLQLSSPSLSSTSSPSSKSSSSSPSSSSSSSSSERCLFEAQETTMDEGFEYSINCSPSFPEAMKACYDVFRQTGVSLYSSMLAVIRSSHAAIYRWCKALRTYEDCLEPIYRLCPHGVQRVYGISFEWKRLYDMAVYVCDLSEGAYLKHLDCYKSLITSTHLPVCREIFASDASNSLMYRLKCPHHNHHIHVHHNHSSHSSHNKHHNISEFRQIEGLMKCMKDEVEKKCGQQAMQVIHPLIRLQYSFDFLPPCVRLKRKTTTTPRTTRRIRFTLQPPFANNNNSNKNSNNSITNRNNNSKNKTNFNNNPTNNSNNNSNNNKSAQTKHLEASTAHECICPTLQPPSTSNALKHPPFLIFLIIIAIITISYPSSSSPSSF